MKVKLFRATVDEKYCKENCCTQMHFNRMCLFENSHARDEMCEAVTLEEIQSKRIVHVATKVGDKHHCCIVDNGAVALKWLTEDEIRKLARKGFDIINPLRPLERR